MAEVNLIVPPAGSVRAQGGPNGDTFVSDLMPRYGEWAKRGSVYVSYSATVATSVAATATIGNMIWNPPGSGVRLYVTKWTSQIVATSASCTGIALAFGYQTTTPTTTTAATFAGSCRVSDIVAVAPKARAYGIATVLTAPLTAIVLHHNTAAINTVGEDMQAGDLEGSVVVEEGGFVTMCALGAAAAASAHTSSLMWIEVPK